MPKLHEILPAPLFQRFTLLQTKARAVSDVLRSTEHIFYQSHMRAYTTLTSHILANSPEIAGYVELHRSYRHAADLVIMRHQVQALSGIGVTRSRYMLDKLLHDGNGVGPEIGQSDAARSIFALRHPSETLPSIVEMVRRTGETMVYGTPEGATSYYVNRVARLAHEATKARNSLYFDAETIVDDTDRLLMRLTDFLELSTPLSEKYDTFAQTGRAGSGDPSANIKSGTIVRDRERPKAEFPSDMIDEATEAYEQARKELITTCMVTITTAGSTT